jgi:hypothetical protein
MSDFFAKIAAANASGGGNYIRDGVYDLTVKSLKENRGHNGYSIIAEFQVDSATPNGEMALTPDGKAVTDKPVVPNPVGSEASVVFNFKHESAAGNVKALALALLASLGYTEAQVDAAAIQALVSDKNPCRGMRIKDATYRKPSKSTGKILVLNRWETVPQTPDDIAKRRKELDESKGAATAPTTQAAAPATTAPSAGGSILGMLGK